MKILIRTAQGATYRGNKVEKNNNGILIEINPKTQMRVFIPYEEVEEIFINKKSYHIDEYINVLE